MPGDFPRWAETLAAQIAPVELPAGLDCLSRPLGGRAYGIAGPRVPRAYGTEAKRPAVVLDLEQLVMDVGGLALGQQWRQNIATFTETAVGLLVHELAHVLSARKMVAPAVPEPQARQAVAACLRESPDAESEIPWQWHNAPWIRVALHVEARASALLGYEVSSVCVAGDEYKLSEAAAYRNALGNEPAAMAHESFATIRTTRPPVAFQELWKADVQRWLGTIAEPTPMQVAAVVAALSLYS